VSLALSRERFERGDIDGYACSGVDPISLGGVHNRHGSAEGITEQALQTVETTVKGLDRERGLAFRPDLGQ
jgi:hypothetical protein